MKGCAALLLYWRPGQTAGAWYGSWRKGMEELLLKLVTAGLLAVIGWIDGRTMEIPYALSGALAICALADFFLFPGLPVGERLMGMVCVSVPMYTLCMVVKEAFGGGDILLISIMGFYLGWRALLPGVFLGFLLGGLEAVWLLSLIHI